MGVRGEARGGTGGKEGEGEQRPKEQRKGRSLGRPSQAKAHEAVAFALSGTTALLLAPKNNIGADTSKIGAETKPAQPKAAQASPSQPNPRHTKED